MMDKERCRFVIIEGLDKLLSYRVFGPTAEQRAVIMAVRQILIDDDELITRIATKVGPYREGEEMSKQTRSKTMTQEEVASFDWAALIAKLPALAALIVQIVELLKTKPVLAKTATKGACPTECHEATHRMLASLADHVVTCLDLHDCIDCCDEQ